MFRTLPIPFIEEIIPHTPHRQRIKLCMNDRLRRVSLLKSYQNNVSIEGKSCLRDLFCFNFGFHEQSRDISLRPTVRMFLHTYAFRRSSTTFQLSSAFHISIYFLNQSLDSILQHAKPIHLLLCAGRLRHIFLRCTHQHPVGREGAFARRCQGRNRSGRKGLCRTRHS